MLPANISDRKGSIIFVQKRPCAVSCHSLILNRNKRLTAFVSHPLILFKLARLQDQLSLPLQKTLWPEEVDQHLCKQGVFEALYGVEYLLPGVPGCPKVVNFCFL